MLYTAAVVAFVLFKCLQVRYGSGLWESWALISWERYGAKNKTPFPGYLYNED